MSNEKKQSDELFEKLSKNRKKKKRKVIWTVLIVIAVVALAIVLAVTSLRRRVAEQFASSTAEVLSYEVTTGTIHTVVSGSGTLTQVGLEAITVPAGVEILALEVKSGDAVAKGDVLASVELSSVMSAMAELQAELDALDDEIADAKGDEVSSYIRAGISGRVKIIYAEAGMDVGSCMAEHGALAVLSLDGFMAVDIEASQLAKGDTVTVTLSDGTAKEGTVSALSRGIATVLITDNGPKYDDTVTVTDAEGTELGSGTLYIHSPLAVTGYAGTIKSLSAKENASVYNGSLLFTLTDTSFSASYDTLLRQREELEAEMLELLTIYRDGAVLASMDGVVSSVDYTESTASSTSLYSASSEEETETALVTLYPNISMSVTIGIDETDILSLQVGQEAEVTVRSASEETFTGVVTEISKVASTTSGVTQYSAVVTLEKTDSMLAGMTAEVDIQIEGVENALIIPVDALHQTSAISYVYTSYDPETQQYGGMVEVVTGMQNDTYVEILSGLNAGDTVYYTEEATFSFGGMEGFGNRGGSGGAEMPGFGNMGDMGDAGGRGPSDMGGFGNKGG